MAKQNLKRLLAVNTFGVFGYITCVLQWLWLSVVFVPLLLDNETVRDFVLPQPTDSQPVSSIIEFDGSSVLLTILAIIITLAILVITVIVLIRLPMAIARTGKKAVSTTADAVLPVVTHHKKLSPTKQRRLTVQLTKYIKLMLCVLPAVLQLFIFAVPAPLAPELVVFVGSVLAIGSLVWFTMEYLVAKWLKVPLQKII